MATDSEKFKWLVGAKGVFSDAEMDSLISHFDTASEKARIGQGRLDQGVRRSQVAALERNPGSEQIFQRIWEIAQLLNQTYFRFDIRDIEPGIQIAQYDAADSGGYGWHIDFSPEKQTRKISISVQLSDTGSYRGGDLEFGSTDKVAKGERTRGAVIAFPSFLRHRVAPVTKGTRYSLVAWIVGPRWR